MVRSQHHISDRIQLNIIKLLIKMSEMLRAFSSVTVMLGGEHGFFRQREEADDA